MPADPQLDRPADQPSGRVAAPVAGLLLAAGTSSRMGTNKLLLDVGGESLLRRSAGRALAGGVAPLLVVLGHQAARAAAELDGLPCQLVANPLYEEGISSSLRAGFNALASLRPAVPAAMVMLGDMPFVTAEMIAALIARYRATAAPLVLSDYAGVQAPPMVYDRALFREITDMAGTCGKQIVKRHHAEAERVPWPAAALADLDLPADYSRFQAEHLRMDEEAS